VKQSRMEKYFKRIGITLIVMATLFLGMGQANAISVVSTLGNSPLGVSDVGNPVGQALSTGEPITDTSATFMFPSDYSPTSSASLAIKDADSIGTIDPTIVATWSSLRVTPVPIPGAVWLFGSGLAGLIGIGRKRLRK